MENKVVQIEVKGDNNVIITDAKGSKISLSFFDLLSKYEQNLEDILLLLKDKTESNAILLAKNIQEYQLQHKKTDFEQYNLYIEQANTNLIAETSKVLSGKTVESLSNKELENLFKKPRVKAHLLKHNLADNESVVDKLRTLSLMTNGYIIKGTFLCLCDINTMRSATSSADYASFGVFHSIDKTNIKSSEEVYGNLVYQYEQLYRLIIQELGALEIIDLLKRESDYIIPEIVFRELLANAFIHRDYSENAAIHTTVEFYADRLVIKNAGKFPDEIDFQNTESIESKPINKEIARIFFLHEIVEKRGGGIARVQAILKKRGMLPAEFKQEAGKVIVTVYKYRKNLSLSSSPKELLANGNYAHLFTVLERKANLDDKKAILDLSISYNGLQQALNSRQIHLDAYKTYMSELIGSLLPFVDKYE